MRRVLMNDRKRLVIVLGGIVILTFVLCNALLSGYRRDCNREYRLALAALVGSVREAYPEADEEEMLVVLNDPQNLEKGGEILSRYGIIADEESSIFRAQEYRLRNFKWELNLLLAVLFAGAACVLFFYLRNRKKYIRRICGYMDELARGNYGLDIADNADDEMSSLKNQVYKLTVFFRELAGREQAGRKALSDSVADISHQLKTPLTSVRILVDDLLDGDDMDDKVRKRFLTEISAQLSGVTWLVSALLKLSRLDAGVVELEEKPLRLRDISGEVVRRLEMAAELKQVEIEQDIPEEIVIKGDAQWLEEAFLNVVKNAVEHSSHDGKVMLKAEENDVYVLFTVQNWGEVIPVEDQKRLFERFYRGRGAGKDSVGIGLALTKEILARQNGLISVESDGTKGTVFSIKFLKCH